MYIAIVSIYGRGDWLAFELARLGYSVILIDLNSGLNFTSEDVEGPFGIFKTKLLESFADRLENESPLLHADNGFTVWLKNSILEFRGPISKFQFSEINKDTKGYLNDLSNVPTGLDFDKSWLAHLSHQLSSTAFRSNSDALNSGLLTPMFSPFYYRLTTRRGVSDFKNKLKGIGIDIYDSIDNITFSSKTVSLGKRVAPYKNLVWMLSSFETDYFLPKLRNKIFKKVIKPIWYWVRYEVSFPSQIFDFLPVHFVNLEDIYLPWSHENLMILQKTISNNYMNCWLRVPSSYDEKKYELLSLKIKQIFENKTNKPVEIVNIPKQQGIGVFPVYDNKILYEKELLIDSPETWDSLSWNGQCVSNAKTLQAVREKTGQVAI